MPTPLQMQKPLPSFFYLFCAMPFLYPQDIFHQLEFDKVLEDLRIRCNGTVARERLTHPPFSTDAIQIRRQLDEIVCFQEILQDSQKIYVSEYRDISDALQMLEIQDSVLDIEDLLEIMHQLSMVSDWFNFFTKEKRIRWKPLYEALATTEAQPKLRQEFYKIFDKEGIIKDSASTDLSKIRKSLHAKTAALDRAFNKTLLRYKDQGVLADNFESYRNGRRVLAVLAEYKRKIKGIIHDESTTGKTVFIQPEETLALDSEFFELQNEERREIRKILKGLCNLLQEHQSNLILNLEVITKFDIIQAKAAQALALGVQTAAKSTDKPAFEWYRAHHPLLLLKHKNNRSAVIPFNLRLDSRNRIILISGPNAGGKTIALKTVGLLCLMHQAGILTPIDDHSTMGVFDQILTDIGDQQSIEHDLSTYTSHLQNMKVFTEKANERSLFLIDEFGAGTEPTIGAAIAESILHRLHYLKARGVITTHYGNLKIMASKTVGIENAGMAFDKEALAPTFHLHIGTPGSSFAFEMAQRSGLHKKIVHHARKKIGKKEGRLDFLLTSLQKGKNELEKKLQAIEEQENKLQRLLKNYERMSLDLDVRRKKLKLDEKQLELQRKSRANKDLEKAIREIRENQNLEKAKELSISLKSQKSALQESAAHIHQEIEEKSQGTKSNKPFAVGDFVRMKMGGVSGAIQSIEKNKVLVLAGNMTLNVKLKDIEHARQPIDIQQQRSVNAHMQMLEEVHHRIDIRGLRKEEAMTRLERFVDKALVAGLAQVEIIHGKGNGVLKNLVTDILKTYSMPYELTHPPHERGGDGVTLVVLG